MDFEKKHWDLISSIISHDAASKQSVLNLYNYEKKNLTRNSVVILNSENIIVYDGRILRSNDRRRISFILKKKGSKKYDIKTFYEFQKDLKNQSLSFIKREMIMHKPKTLVKAIMQEICYYPELKRQFYDALNKDDSLNILDFKVPFNWTDDIHERVEEIIDKLRQIKFPVHVEFTCYYSYLFGLTKTIGQYCELNCKCDKQVNIYLVFSSNNTLGFQPFCLINKKKTLLLKSKKLNIAINRAQQIKNTR